MIWRARYRPRAVHTRDARLPNYESTRLLNRKDERQVGSVVPDRNVPAVFQRAEEDFVGEPIAHFRLDHAGQRARAEDRVVALLREVRARVWLERNRAAALGQLLFELDDELVDDRLHHLRRERLEADDRVEPVAELRAEHFLHRRLGAALRRALAVA